MPYKNPVAQREYQRRRVAARRAQWIKENGPCVRCGSWSILEVDHIDPTQKADHRIWSWATAKMLSELVKCQVLCSNCHKTKSATDRRSMLTFRGETLPMAEWARRFGLSQHIVSHRLWLGWSIERALTQPRQKYPSTYVRRNQTRNTDQL